MHSDFNMRQSWSTLLIESGTKCHKCLKKKTVVETRPENYLCCCFWNRPGKIFVNPCINFVKIHKDLSLCSYKI